MLFIRWIIGLLLLAGLLCLGLYLATGQARWRQLGIVIVKWTVIASLGFFGILILERMALMI